MTTLRDPVCGKEVDALRARAVGIWGGRTFYFCCTAHKTEFARDPARYLREDHVAPAAVAPLQPPVGEPTVQREPPSAREPERREKAPALRGPSDLGPRVLPRPISAEGASSALMAPGRQRLWLYLAVPVAAAAIGAIVLLATRI
jgi:YHS domain-containing protein